MTEHVWAVWTDSESLFTCGRCGILADRAWTISKLPAECPGERPKLPHLVRVVKDAFGSAITCVCCILPPLSDWDWECGGDRRLRSCDKCAQRRRSVAYDYYLMSNVCGECFAQPRKATSGVS